jgi:hypothetical protein
LEWHNTIFLGNTFGYKIHDVLIHTPTTDIHCTQRSKFKKKAEKNYDAIKGPT